MCMYRWMRESVSEWCECGVHEWGVWEWLKWVSERASEWMSEWVREWVSGWVGGWVNEKEDGRRKKADTELKTKTLHVNVGKPCTTPAMQKQRSPRHTREMPEDHQRHARESPKRIPEGRQKDAKETLGCISGPLAIHVIYAYHIKSAESKERQRHTRRMSKRCQGIHLTPWHCTLSTPAIHLTPWHCTLSTPATKSGGTRPHQRDARTYIRPLNTAYCPTPTTQKHGNAHWVSKTMIIPYLSHKSSGVQGTPEGR